MKYLKIFDAFGDSTGRPFNPVIQGILDIARNEGLPVKNTGDGCVYIDRYVDVNNTTNPIMDHEKFMDICKGIHRRLCYADAVSDIKEKEANIFKIKYGMETSTLEAVWVEIPIEKADTSKEVNVVWMNLSLMRY